MRPAALLRWTLPALFTGLLVAVNCTGSMNDWASGEGPFEEVPPACDPDGVAPCPDDWFICVEDDVGGKHCEGQQPATPDDGGTWICEVVSDSLVCRGDHVPEDAGDWTCREEGDEVVCEHDSYVPGSEGNEGRDWDCHYEGEFLVCDSEGGSGGGDADADSDADSDIDSDADSDIDSDVDSDIDSDVDGDVDSDVDGDGDADGGDDCLCVPGAWRYCDTPTYCNWGVQYCNDDGLSWGACTETTPPLVCGILSVAYTPVAEACCIASGFCCQDFHDVDFDGDTWESLGDCVDIVCE